MPVNITPQVQQCLEESDIKDGFVLCNAMHITASVFINDDESGFNRIWPKDKTVKITWENEEYHYTQKKRIYLSGAFGSNCHYCVIDVDIVASTEPRQGAGKAYGLP
ncbi:MAG: YjbQ family protein [Sedimentisphaerales bacterium]|nr:YjbQ family protein [Sedimentisphaerales bacterium]